MIDAGFTGGLILGIALAMLAAWGADGNKAGFRLVLVILVAIAMAVGNAAFAGCIQ